jgi:hypothetical protein
VRASSKEGWRAMMTSLRIRTAQGSARTLRVVTLRRSITARFSTNYFHNTWHILTDHEGAYVLARLLWGLSFQKIQNTIVLIDRNHLVTTPFDGDEADPIIVARERLDARALRVLSQKLSSAPQTTVRWHTFGLPTSRSPERWEKKFIETTERLAGFACCFANDMALQETARKVWDMRSCGTMDYYFLDDCRRYQHASGEVQVFRWFRDMVVSAKLARRIHRERVLSDDQREAVQAERVHRLPDQHSEMRRARMTFMR